MQSPTQKKVVVVEKACSPAKQVLVRSTAEYPVCQD